MSGTAAGGTSGGPVVRFRHHRARTVAGVIFIVSLLTLVAVSPWFALLMLPPAAWTLWAWRAGTDADRRGVRVRALLAARRLDWSQIEALHVERPGRVTARRPDGGGLVLTGVTAADLPRLSALSGPGPGGHGSSATDPPVAADDGGTRRHG